MKSLHMDLGTPLEVEKRRSSSSTYFSGDSELNEKNISILEVIELVKDKSKPLLVIEHDGANHYSAYAPPGFQQAIKPCLSSVLQHYAEEVNKDAADTQMTKESTSDQPQQRAKSTRQIKKPKLSIG